MRLNKFLAEKTGISRRQADELIKAGRVSIGTGESVRGNEQREAIIGERVESKDIVFLDGKSVENRAKHKTVILNKPVGYLSSRASQGGDPTVYDLLPQEFKNLKTAGRLDKNSSGLMILSSDGDLIQRLTHPRFEKTKVYEVELDKPLRIEDERMINRGIKLPDGMSKIVLHEVRITKQEVRGIAKDKSATVADRDSLFLRRDSGGDNGKNASYEITSHARRNWQVTMTEGRNRQIRRTFAALGYDVKKLHRTHLGKYSLNNLKPGAWAEIN